MDPNLQGAIPSAAERTLVFGSELRAITNRHAQRWAKLQIQNIPLKCSD